MKTASQPLVSIVTPLYNEARHLAECIESVLGQTYQNWDYTVVDNCSTDGSMEVARRYAAIDRRIRIHKNPQFLQAIPNHNAALRQISPLSKYCKVVFADDWIFPRCLEEMVNMAEQHSSVGIVGAYVLEGQRVICTGLPYSKKLVSGREICREHLLKKLYIFGSANSLLYRADLVRGHDPFYDEENIHSDTEKCFALLKSCDFGFVHQVLTFTRVRPESLTALSTDFQTNLAGKLQILITHGQDFLTQEEFGSLVKRHMSQYYRFLGKTLILGHDERVWNYHKEKLIQAGVGFSWVAVLRGLLTELGKAFLTPKQTVAKLVERRSHTRPSGAKRAIAAW